MFGESWRVSEYKSYHAMQARKSRKIYRKFVLVRRAGWFLHHSENAVAQELRGRVMGRLFYWIERWGNTLFSWGEEIECVVVKA